MLTKENEMVIFDDLWHTVNYEYKSWRDFNVAIVDNSLVYRFPKRKVNFQKLIFEKRVLDIISPKLSVEIPNVELINWELFKYKFIPWKNMEEIDFTRLSDKNKENFVNTIVNTLKELHSIELDFFNFLELEKDKSKWGDILSKDIYDRLNWKVNNYSIKKIEKYLHDYFSLKFNNYAFIHTDMKKANIIMDDTNYTINWIIDFSNWRLTGIEEEFIFFLEFWEDIFNEIVKKYLWKLDNAFIERVKFIYKKLLIFEILNDNLYRNNFAYLKSKISTFSY